MDSIYISPAEEKALLREWFETVQFDEYSEGIPPLDPERDDEESRAKLDAEAITDWFETPASPLPESRMDGIQYAHQNGEAWEYVDVGVDTDIAKSLMDLEIQYQAPKLTPVVEISNRKADDLAKRTKPENGGFTVDPRTGKDLKEGYSVAIYPERSVQVRSLNRTRIREYVTENRDLFSEGGHMLSAWHDPEDNSVWMDVSKVETDKRAAIELAKEYELPNVFDLGSGNAVNTEGSGNSSYPFVFTRANPYHDGKSGKFASKNGGFKAVSREQGIAHVESSIRESVAPGLQRIYERKHGPEWANKKAVETVGNGTVHVNGKHRVIFKAKVSESDQSTVLNTLGNLQRKNPNGHDMDVVIDTPDTFRKDMLGLTGVGSGRMRINSKVFTTNNTTGLMPSAKSNPAEYIIAHEYGHTLQPAHGTANSSNPATGDSSLFKENKAKLSRYGGASSTEGYAEAFADWHVSGGQSDNSATQAYGKYFGWGH